MAILRDVRSYSRKLVVKEMVRMLPKLSMRNMCKIIDLGKKLISREDYKAIADGLKTYIEEGHPTVKVIEKVLYNLSPECRYRTVYNLFILALLDKTSLRESFKEELGFRPPFSLVVSPTMRGNLKCYGCYAGEYEQGFGLSHEVLDRVISEGQELGIHFIIFSGGEPFIRTDLLDLYEKHRDVIFQVYTNGTLIDEQLAKKLARLGNVAPMIRLEGFEKETNERRGKGYFQKVMRAMDYLRQEGVLFGSSVTQTRQNMDTISSDEFVDMLVEKGVFLIWYLQYVPIGKKPDISLMLTPQQRDTVRRRLRRIRDTKPLFICDFWNDGPCIDGCLAAGREYFHINANGDVEPCVFAHFAVDNIKEKSLKEVLTSQFFKEIRSRQPFSENPLKPCMIIDHPHTLREGVRKCHVYPTEPTMGYPPSA